MSGEGRSKDPGVPVLAYHGNNVSGNDYASNDHVALATDLETLHATGWTPVGLDEVVAWQRGVGGDRDLERRYAITFDDASDFDVRDIDHPTCGLQKSLLNVLREFARNTDTPVAASSFVIASPEAREVLDERCLVGRGWWNDDWWAEANAEGILAIECHGWDHLHPVLDEVAQVDGKAGDFRYIDTLEDCHRQLRDAATLVARRAGGRRPRHFAFPWGQFSDYLVNHYLPEYEAEHGFEAAFTTVPASVRRSDNRWRLPRYVCGEAWRSTGELSDLLERGQG